MWAYTIPLALLLVAWWLLKRNFFNHNEQQEREKTQRYLAGYYADKKPRQHD